MELLVQDFLGSGYTIHEAGPGGAIVAYLVGGFVMYLTMLCLGELAVAMPDAGSYQTYATKHISPKRLCSGMDVMVKLVCYDRY